MAMSFEFVSGRIARTPKKGPKYLRLPETVEEKRLLKEAPRLYREYCRKLEIQTKQQMQH